MPKKTFFLPGILGLLLLLLAACAPQQIPAEKQCTQDSDCLPSTCCHPNDAVNKDFTPNCKGILCTQECVPGTIDCGQGEIKCGNGRCKTVLK